MFEILYLELKFIDLCISSNLFFFHLPQHIHSPRVNQPPDKEAEPQTGANENRTPSKDIAIGQLDFKTTWTSPLNRGTNKPRKQRQRKRRIKPATEENNEVNMGGKNKEGERFKEYERKNSS